MLSSIAPWSINDCEIESPYWWWLSTNENGSRSGNIRQVVLHGHSSDEFRGRKQDVPNKTKTVGFTIKIGDVFGLVSKVFANRGDDEEEAGGEEDFEAETEEFPEEELNENISNVRKYLYDYLLVTAL